jgi:organic radical activating enzyme
MSEKKAVIVELFSSIQGEGPFVGLRQVFLRFHGCNLTCSYCDTNIGEPPPACRIEGTPGRRDFHEAPNPIALKRVLSQLEGWERGWPGIHHSISITGGEPLLNHELLQEWLPKLRNILPIYLETNGILHLTLSRVIGSVDYISMDIKIPSTSGCTELWNQHAEFLKVASRKDLFVKVVVSDTTEEWEIERACQIVSDVDPGITVILQPVTLENGRVGIAPIRCLELQEVSVRYLKEVRIIPQTHKFTGQI